MIDLRRLEQSDMEKIALWPSYENDLQQMDYALRNGGWLEEFRGSPDAKLYAAMDSDDLVGFSLLIKGEKNEAEFRIALRADQTGRGLGDEITVLTLKKGFEEQGLSRIHLIVRKNNQRAIALYTRLGFGLHGECRREILNQPVDFLMMEMYPEQFRQLQLQREEKTSTISKRALLVIDVQNDYFPGGKLPIVYPEIERSGENISLAIDFAKRAGIPVVAVENIAPENAPFLAGGSSGARLHPSIQTRGWDHLITKRLPGAFTGTDLEEWLRANKVETLTIMGYMTQNCDLATTIQAFHSGFHVEFLSDATGTIPYSNLAGSVTAEEIHRVVTVVMQARFAAVMTTACWIEMIGSGETARRDTIYGSFQQAISCRTG